MAALRPPCSAVVCQERHSLDVYPRSSPLTGPTGGPSRQYVRPVPPDPKGGTPPPFDPQGLCLNPPVGPRPLPVVVLRLLYRSSSVRSSPPTPVPEDPGAPPPM